ncbi:unnamed protein product, partial [Meganyctiphanes norvegica]
MVRITLDMVRKRAEHNEGELSSMEEISLHQHDIEKIEHLHRWCPRLKILYLQGNLISKIENLSRLRELVYLNLALNNIENVEGLENCDALSKLDFTANFITDLSSLTSLQDCTNLKELYLTGNPCCEYRGYREWVMTLLPGLQELDGRPITRAERITALQALQLLGKQTWEDQQAALEKRAESRRKHEKEQKEKPLPSEHDNNEDDETWGNEMTEHSPEARVAMHREIEQRRAGKNTKENEKKNKKKERPLFSKDGRPLNLNEAKLDFTFKEDEELNAYVLDVDTYRYMDASQVKCEVEPWYVQVTVKGKMLQLVMFEEVRPGQSTAQRSQITGHLVITMPKLSAPIGSVDKQKIQAMDSIENKRLQRKSSSEEGKSTDSNRNSETRYLELSEAKSSLSSKVDYRNIVKEGENGDSLSRQNTTWTTPGTGQTHTTVTSVAERPNSPGFVDNSDVPPLE